MARVHDELRAAGIAIGPANDEGPAVRTECARLARRMRERLVHSLGLFPAGDDVAVPAVAITLGSALADKSPTAVGVVDAHGSWACARTLAEAAPPDGTLSATSWLRDGLAILTPRIFEAGTMLAQLEHMLVERAADFSHFVVDLTGFDHLGEQLAAFALLDGVVVVARSGRTTTHQIQRRIRDLPQGRSLGVLLTGL